MSDPSQGLFTVVCECQTIFPAEAGICPSCQQTKGKLQLNIPKFLDRVYSLIEDENKSNARALDVVFDVFWNLHARYDIMNDILGQVDINRLNETLMVGFLVQTFKYIDQVPNHLVFCDHAEARMRELGVSEKDIQELVGNYRETGDYWKNMKALGAPEWLTGPKPNS